MHTIPFDDIRILCHKFSRLPAQAFTCHLYGIGSIDEDVLSEIVDKDCTINIVTIEHEVIILFCYFYLNVMSKYNRLPLLKLYLLTLYR